MKKILFISAIIISAGLAAFFVFFSSVGQAADSSDGQAHLTEVLYDFIYCRIGSCENKRKNGEGFVPAKPLFGFYGYDANCDYFGDVCDGETTAIKKENCLNREKNKCLFRFPYGRSGSIETGGSFYANGMRTYLDGYDRSGYHWFRTGQTNPGGQVIGFRENSRDVYFNGNLAQSSQDADVVVGNDFAGSGEASWPDSPQKEYIKESNGNLQFFSGETLAEANGGFSVYGGLEVNSVLKTDSFNWRGDTGAHRQLLWTPVMGMSSNYPNPSRENKHVLFYCEPVSGSGPCQ